MSLPPERELIAALTEGLESERNRAGLTDDCAVVPLGEVDLVASLDTFAEDSHFPPGTPPKAAGRMATAAALSDLAAAGAELVGGLVGYGLPPSMTPSQARELARGVHEVLQAHDGEVLGGDTKPRQTLQLSITTIGTCEPRAAMSRSNAQEGDAVLVTGPLGGAGAALERIQAGLDPSRADPLLDPVPRLRAGIAVRDAGVRCAMDLSDGLGDGAAAIAASSQARVVVEAERIPLHPWAREDERGLEHALSFGGDYELVLSAPEDLVDRVLATLEALELEPAIVGRVEPGSGAVLSDEEGEHVLDRGYEHRFGPA